MIEVAGKPLIVHIQSKEIRTDPNIMFSIIRRKLGITRDGGNMLLDWLCHPLTDITTLAKTTQQAQKVEKAHFAQVQLVRWFMAKVDLYRLLKKGKRLLV